MKKRELKKIVIISNVIVISSICLILGLGVMKIKSTKSFNKNSLFSLGSKKEDKDIFEKKSYNEDTTQNLNEDTNEEIASNSNDYKNNDIGNSSSNSSENSQNLNTRVNSTTNNTSSTIEESNTTKPNSSNNSNSNITSPSTNNNTNNTNNTEEYNSVEIVEEWNSSNGGNSNNQSPTPKPTYEVDTTIDSFLNGYNYKLTSEQVKSIPIGENITYENSLGNYLVSNYGKSYDRNLNKLAKSGFNGQDSFNNEFNNFSSKYNNVTCSSFYGGYIYHPSLDLNTIIREHIKSMDIKSQPIVGVYAEYYRDSYSGVFKVRGAIVYASLK